MADAQFAVIADAPAGLDDPQAQIVFFPAEEQCLVIAAGLRPGGAADGVSGAHEGDRIEPVGSARQQAARVAPGQQVVLSGRVHQNAQADRRQVGRGVQHGHGAGQRVGRGENRVVVQPHDHPAMTQRRRSVAPARHAVIVPDRHQRRVVAPIHRGGELRQYVRPRPLVQHQHMAGDSALFQRGVDGCQCLIRPIQRQDQNIRVVHRGRRRGRPRDQPMASRVQHGLCASLTRRRVGRTGGGVAPPRCPFWTRPTFGWSVLPKR
jgi:hypothetical protein